MITDVQVDSPQNQEVSNQGSSQCVTFIVICLQQKVCIFFGLFASDDDEDQV